MEKGIEVLKNGSIVFACKMHYWIQLETDAEIQFTQEFWGKGFVGLPLSVKVISEFWPEFLETYHSEYIRKFTYLGNSDKELFSFFGVYSSKDPDPILKDASYDESIDSIKIIPDSELFINCYYRWRKKIFFKYVHELQNILDTVNIGRPKYDRI